MGVTGLRFMKNLKKQPGLSGNMEKSIKHQIADAIPYVVVISLVLYGAARIFSKTVYKDSDFSLCCSDDIYLAQMFQSK